MPDQATTHRLRSRLFARGALAMLPVVLLGVAISLWSRGGQRDASPGAESPVVEKVGQAVRPAKAQAERPGEVASSQGMPVQEVGTARQPELTKATPDAGIPAVREKRGKRVTSRAKHVAAPHAAEAATEPSPAEPMPSQNDRQVHRAGRVTRDQF